MPMVSSRPLEYWVTFPAGHTPEVALLSFKGSPSLSTQWRRVVSWA
jgi:hypothetical protein